MLTTSMRARVRIKLHGKKETCWPWEAKLGLSCNVHNRGSSRFAFAVLGADPDCTSNSGKSFETGKQSCRNSHGGNVGASQGSSIFIPLISSSFTRRGVAGFITDLLLHPFLTIAACVFITAAGFLHFRGRETRMLPLRCPAKLLSRLNRNKKNLAEAPNRETERTKRIRV